MKTSIIITSYNYENFIAKAVESVINQTVSDWELIIVDDGSKDNSVNIIKKYCEKDNRIKLFTHPDNKNHGLRESVLLGIEKCSNDWIAFLESDDYWSPYYLEEKIKALKTYPDVNFIYNDVEIFGDVRKKIKFQQYFNRLNKIWENNDVKDVFDNFGSENIVPTFSCVMCNKNELLKCSFNPVVEPILDYWLWWQLAENNNFCYVKQKLTFWRLHKTSCLSKSMQSYKFYTKRFLFISEITKIFKRKPKLSTKHRFEKNKIFSFAIYMSAYFKNLFKTGRTNT